MYEGQRIKVVRFEVRKVTEEPGATGPYGPCQGLPLFLRERQGAMEEMDRIAIEFVIQILASLLIKMLNQMGH